MSDRPTPETDALDCELHNPKVLQDRYSTMLEHSRKLERERDEARETADRYRVAFCSAKGDLVPQAFPWEEAAK